MLYPLLFTPVLKDYLWGGRNLAAKLGRELPAGIVAESWEIAGHNDGTTLVVNGHWAGYSLTDLLAEYGLDLIGRRSQWALERNKFPLLVKLLDAQTPLSIQVHPNDDYALEHEGNELGKTEMWVILHAEENAQVLLGVKEGTTPEKFRQALENGEPEPFLHHIPVKTGDHICVPAGSLHAIMGGLLIAEIQQNSNTTYRVYDWNRVGADGKARPLHLTQAMEVTNFAQVEPTLCPPQPLADPQPGVERALLCQNHYFTVERVTLAAGATFSGVCDGSTFEIWGVTAGAAAVQGGGQLVELPAVTFTLLPAQMGDYTITAAQPTTLLRTYVAEE